MKLAEGILKIKNGKSVDESMRSSDGINVDLGDGHRVSVHYGFEIYKIHEDSGNFIRIDNVERQSAIKDLIKEDADVFMKAVADKLKSAQGI